MSVRPPKVGSQIEVTAERLDPSGAGVGSTRTIIAHVRDLLPGERARACVEHVSPHRPHTVWARILDRLGPPASARAQPACPRFGECGGCVWQHLAYSAQLEHKRARVTRALNDHGLGDAAVAAALPAPATTGYRNVGKYVVGPPAQRSDDTGLATLTLGSYAPRSHRLVDTAGCRIVEPVIDQVRALAARAWRHLPAYDERARTGWLRYITVRTGSDGAALCAVVTSSDAQRAAVVHGAKELALDSRVSGVVWVRNDSRSGTIIDGPQELLCGRATVRERVAEVDIDLGVGDFFQVNRTQLTALYNEIADQALRSIDDHRAESLTVIDAYCGVGGIAFTLAARARRRGRQYRIFGIERNPRAVNSGTRAAESADLGEWVSFQSGAAADMARLKPDIIVVNPPRKGLDAATRAAVRNLAPARVVYVSCGPRSLARDLRAFVDDYRIGAVQPIDLMPGTPQIETVVRLDRRS